MPKPACSTAIDDSTMTPAPSESNASDEQRQPDETHELRVAAAMTEMIIALVLIYLDTMPIVLSHVSTRCGHSVIGDSVGRSPNA